MGYTPRQIAVRAQETAWRMLSTLDRERIVVNFVEAYVREHCRFGIRAQAEYSREFMETIRRECLLEMVTHLDSELPRRLGFLAHRPAKPAARGDKKGGKNKGKAARNHERVPRVPAPLHRYRRSQKSAAISYVSPGLNLSANEFHENKKGLGKFLRALGLILCA